MPLGDWTIFKMLVDFLRSGSHIGITHDRFCVNEDLLEVPPMGAKGS
jgi:hypothetical protein